VQQFEFALRDWPASEMKVNTLKRNSGFAGDSFAGCRTQQDSNL
jgi:hypothetical protein